MKYLIIILVGVTIAFAGVIHPQLAEKISDLNPDQTIQVIVHMKKQADWSNVARTATKAEKILYLQSLAEHDQADLLNWLAKYGEQISNLNTWWIFNGLTFKATKDIIEQVADRSDVDYVIDDFIVKLHDVKIRRDNSNVESRTPEWNISIVSAPQCWNAGYDGTGIIVGNMDTGVDVSHPALAGKWITGGWYDAVNGQSSPYDDHGHGTHTMGTTCGGDGNGSFTNDIGVAPGANFICAKAFDSNGSGQSSWIHNCFQWFAGQNAVVVGNSWGSSATTSTEYWNDCDNWRNLGIYPVFSIGNSGPNSGTAGTPGNFPIVTGVGGTDSNDNMYYYSSRGPAPNQYPWNDTTYWGRSDWNLIKPDIAAPGQSVRSSLPGGGYGQMSGTSMACPHVTGAVAICLQKNPSLDYETLYNILLDNADHPSQGGSYPNNNYGWGRLNVYAALQAVPQGNMPNIVLNRSEVVGGNGNGMLDPGESAGIVCYLRNTGTVAATSTQATLRTSDTYVTITDSTTSYGSIAAGDSANNSGDPFDVTVSGSCPVGHQVNFDLYIACAESSWTRSFTLTVGGVVGEDYVTHDCGNVKLTVTRYGAIGFMSSAGTQGSGFWYPITGSNHLYYASFAAGTDANYVVDRYYEVNQQDDTDWETTTNPDGKVKMYEPGPNNIDEYTSARYDDAGHPTPQGLLCLQNSWAWDDATANDFVIMKFSMINNGSSTLSNLYAAVFIDWDIGNYSNNQGSSEAARNLTWMYETTPYVGVAILDPPRSTPAANLAFIDHDLYVYPNSGLQDSIQIKFMDGTIQNPSTDRAYDWSTCNSAGPFTLSPGGSAVAAFAIVGGDNLSDLQANADTAYNRYWGWPGVEEKPSETMITNTVIYPRISHAMPFTLSYNLEKESTVKVSIYDASGRLVNHIDYGRLQGTGNVNFSLRNYATGVYFVKTELDNTAKTSKLIWIK